MPTNMADKLTVLLGVEGRARHIMDAIEEGGASAQIARETLANLDDGFRTRMALSEIGHALDGIRVEMARRNDRLAKLEEAHEAVMSGSGIGCRTLADATAELNTRLRVLETRVIIYVTIATVVFAPVWALIVNKLFGG